MPWINSEVRPAADPMSPSLLPAEPAELPHIERETEALPEAKRGKSLMRRFFNVKKESGLVADERAETDHEMLPVAPSTTEQTKKEPPHDARRLDEPSVASTALSSKMTLSSVADAATSEAQPAELAPAAPALPEPESIAKVRVPGDVLPAGPANSARHGAPPAPGRPDSLSISSEPRPIMTSTDHPAAPSGSRASAQLTLGFEVTSLQLTPFFKLGSVQLKALSNVVSLHLMAAQSAESPLAAGISFRIQRVELDEASHIKSIQLQPLGESRELTAPRSNLQVDNVAVMEGSRGAPISVKTSEGGSMAVQLLGTFTIAAMEFTPAFEIGSLRLEPATNTVLVRVAPSARSASLDLPPTFEMVGVQTDSGAQIVGVEVTPVVDNKS